MSERWNLPKQQYLVENGQDGDCWSCCIAAVLGVPRDDVPHFLKMQREEGGSMDPDTQRWLNQRGYVLIEANKFQFPRWFGDAVPMPPVIAAGPTPRSKKIGDHHVVVIVDDKMVYDPHPSEAGLTAVTEEYLIVPIMPVMPA